MDRLRVLSRFVCRLSAGNRAAQPGLEKNRSNAKLLTGCVVAASLCAYWPLAADDARASSIEITGSLFGTPQAGPFPGYGTSISQHNVVGYSYSGISDPTGGAAWRVGGAVLANASSYTIDWYFSGAESGDSIRFTSKSLRFTEHDQNNSFTGGKQGWWKLGTTSGSGIGPIPFSLKDLDTNSGVTNGATSFIASLMLAYVEPVYVDVIRKGRARKVLTGWNVTTEKTDWFAFGFNDPGSSDRDYDDFVGIGHVIAKGGYPPSPVPIPGALVLMGTVLGGGYLVGSWRRRQARRRRVAVA